jgi:subtilisin family serine protease
MKHSISVSVLALALAGCGGGGSGSNDPGSQVPDQPVSFDTGHLETINQDYAALRSITGSGVTVAVIDDGVNITHDEFGGKSLNQNSGYYEASTDFYTFQEQQDLGISGLDLYDPNDAGEQEDGTGHGTDVASMIFGENVGVSPGVDLVVLDVQDGSTPSSVAAIGLIQELGGFGVDFANVSMTGVDSFEDNASNDAQSLVDPLDADDIGWIVSGGNFGNDQTEFWVTNQLDCSTVAFSDRTDDQKLACRKLSDPQNFTPIAKVPSLADNLILVGAVDRDTLELSVFPSIFSGIDGGSATPGTDSDFQDRWIVAPGSALSTASSTDNTGYRTVPGTSFAAPQVTGAAALVKGQFPSLTNAEVLQVLLDTADDSFASFEPALHGQGLLDVEAALIEAAVRAL